MPQIVEFNGSRIEFPDGMAAADIESALKKNAMSIPAAVSTGQAMNKGMSDIPRQLGLTARYALEGPAQAAQIFTEPVAGLMRAGGIPTRSLGDIATSLADRIGLPQPQGANERVIADAAKLVAGAGGMGVAAGAGRALPGITGQVMAGLAANPTQQLSSAAGAGLLGGSSREAGGSPLMQAGAGLLGAVGGGLAPSLGPGVASLARRVATPSMTPQQIDVELTSILGRAGSDFAALPGNAKRSLRNELASALQAGKEVDPQAVRRLAEIRAVGGTPTRGMVTLDPVQITRERNLSKIGANSNDGQLQGLAQIENRNNLALIDRLNEVGGRSETIPMTAGQAVQDRIASTAAGFRNAEQDAWNAAKAMPGYTQPIFPDGLNAANRALGDEGMMAFMPKQISDYMAAFQTGQQPFTPQAYRNLQSMLSGAMSEGGNTSAAARIARQALESVPMTPLTETGRDIGSAPVTQAMASALRATDAQPQQAIDAVNAARAATAKAYRYEESSPLVRAALSDSRTADPERIAQSFIINGSLREAQSVAQEVGEQGIPVIRDALATHIKKAALSGANDEVGKVSQSALNSALRKIGVDKLRLFFSPEEINSLQATGRVASYMQVQPVGSAVNNSNSGALALGRGADLLGAAAGRVPFGAQVIADPLRNINISLSQRQAQNIQPGLLVAPQKQPLLNGLLLPAFAASGGLLSP